MAKHRKAETLCEFALADAIWRAPHDHYVIWTGVPAGAQPGSLRSRALALVEHAWQPVALRDLLRRAATVEAGSGLHPDLVRSAVRMHQAARPAVHLLARRTLAGDYVAVVDIPFPAGLPRPLRAGELVLGRDGRRADTTSRGDERRAAHRAATPFSARI